jgi:hypothetical protein
MDISKIPSWLLAGSLALISIGFIVSLFLLEEPRIFAGLEFGPKTANTTGSKNKSIVIGGNELPSDGGNRKSPTCPENTYMIGNRFQIDGGGSHGIVSNIFPICRSLNISIE